MVLWGINVEFNPSDKTGLYSGVENIRGIEYSRVEDGNNHYMTPHRQEHKLLKHRQAVVINGNSIQPLSREHSISKSKDQGKGLES